jgi:NAD(P)H-nitrite reductase large subunit
MNGMGPDDRICYCYNVPYRKLWHFARRRELQRASQMSECLGAGTGCGWCIPILKRIFEASRSPGRGDVDGRGEVEIEMTAEEYAAQRQTYIREKKPRNQF